MSGPHFGGLSFGVEKNDMDGTGRIYWRAFSFLGLLCALFVITTSANAAVRKGLTPSAPHKIHGSSTAVYSRNGDNLHGENAIEGEYIPSSYGSPKGTKLPVRSAVDHSIPRIIKAGSNSIRGGLVGVAASIALGAMLDSVGGFIEDNQPKKHGCLLNGNPVANSYCQSVPAGSSGVHQYGVCNYYPASETVGKVKIFTYQRNLYAHQAVPYVSTNGFLASGWAVINNCTNTSAGYVAVDGRFPVAMRKLISSTDIKTGPVPLESSDYTTMEAFADGQSAAWLRSLLRESCSGSASPNACIDSLSNNAKSYLSGPSQVQGPFSTTTSTQVGPDGIAHQVTKSTSTTYNITYGDNYYDYKTTTTTTTNTDGQNTGTDTTTDGDDVVEEIPPTEPDDSSEPEITPAPCLGEICDGPAYQDMYEPTDKKKEDAIDSYASRVASIPIIAAVGGLFDVSASGACPVWSYVGSADILGVQMDIDLTFDYLCQPWFTSYGPWIQAVMLLVGVYAAIRIALL